MSLSIRRAEQGDVDLVMGFVRALADYENLLDQVIATPADIARDMFGPAPRIFCEIAEWDGQPAGFATWFYTYSTFVGRHGLYLEDLFVDPALRGRGIGKSLLVHLARICAEERLGFFQWQVLDWNEPSIAFYKSLGAVPQDDWITMRVAGDALDRLGDTPITGSP